MSPSEPASAPAPGLDLPDPSASPEALYAAACAALGRVQAKERETDQLKRRLEEAEATQTESGGPSDQPAKKKSKTSSASDAEELNKIIEVEDNIKQKAKQYCLMCMLWLPSASPTRYVRKLLSAGCPEDGFQEKLRYVDDENLDVGRRVDLYTLFGSDIMDRVSSDNQDRFKTLFLEGMRSQRSEVAHRINKLCPASIFGSDLLELDRSALNEKLGWKAAHRNKPARWSTLDIELLHRVTIDDDGVSDWSGTHSFDNIFCSRYLFRIGATVLFGPSALEEYLKHEDEYEKGRDGFPPSSKTSTNGVLWELEEITPGFIASCACLMLFALSADDAFTETGQKSRIPYKSLHQKWVKWLHTGFHSDTEHVVALFKKWNKIFFSSGSVSTKQARTDGDESDSELEDSLKLMNPMDSTADADEPGNTEGDEHGR